MLYYALLCSLQCCAVQCNCAWLCLLCRAVLCRAVLCCAVLCRAVLCCGCAVLCCAVAALCCSMPCCAVLCCAVLCCAVLRLGMIYAVPSRAVLFLGRMTVFLFILPYPSGRTDKEYLGRTQVSMTNIVRDTHPSCGKNACDLHGCRRLFVVSGHLTAVSPLGSCLVC